MRLNEPRIPALDPASWNDEQKTVFRAQMIRGRVPNIFRTLSNHVKLAKRWLVFGNHILAKSTLNDRDREILILRIGWLCRAEYEWGQHVVIGRRAGLQDADIAAIKEGPEDPHWQGRDALLLRAVDELHRDAFIADDTWAGIRAFYSQEQMMDLVFTVGQYNLVSMALNSFGVQLDDDIRGFDG